MSASDWYLLLSLFGAAWTASAWFGFRHLGPGVAVYFFMSWLTGELALVHIAWQAAATLLFVGFGGLEGAAGALGLGISFGSWAALLVLHQEAHRAGPALERALQSALGPDYRQQIPEARRAGLRDSVELRDWIHPFRFPREGVEVVRDIAYGPEGKRNRLDVYKPAGEVHGAPVLLQVHGGGWVIGEKEQQALPLMRHLAQRGWVCVAANYRLGPKARFPDPLIDLKRAIAWIREHVDAYGGDPGWLAVTGGSAGGHLCSLLALTAGEPRFQPGFEEVDTRVDAAVPFYGVYDFVDRDRLRGRSSMQPFLERMVMPRKLAEAPELWDEASPIHWVREDAPPFFVIHGDVDALAFVEQARAFVAALRAKSRNPVAYAEIPRAQHAFEVFNSVRSAYAVHAVARFLEWARARDERTRERGAA